MTMYYDDIQDSTDLTSSRSMYANSAKASALGRRPFTRRGDSADEIDPRKLVRDPYLSELRWYYRRTFGKKLVDKPIDDAFKNGFELSGPDMAMAQRVLEETNYEKSYMLGEKKARRDGFALVFIGTRDNSAGIHQSPFDDNVRVDALTHTKVLTIDDLCYCAADEIAEQVEVSYPDLDRDNYRVRHTGIVINTDPASPDYRDPIGYAMGVANGRAQFIHRDRVQHLVWNEEVDGDYDRDHDDIGYISRWRQERPLGKWEGDSILVASYDLLKGITKGNWAIMQGLFRNASHMYAVHLPSDADEDEFNQAMSSLTNMNAKSELILPRGTEETQKYEVQQFKSGDMLEPQEYFDVVFDQICAVHEMTKSVLFGTQSGVVSGSETDIKNYFNQVERYRQNRGREKIMDFLGRAKNMLDGRTGNNATVNVELEWGPLFKVSNEDRLSMFMTQAQALTMMINGYMMTPDEARAVLSEEWAEIDLDSLTEEQRDELDRINLTQVGAWQGAERNEPDEPRGQSGTTQQQTQGSGMQQGQQTSELSNMDEAVDTIMANEQFMDKLADKIAQKITENQ